LEGVAAVKVMMNGDLFDFEESDTIRVINSQNGGEILQGFEVSDYLPHSSKKF
jgi:hypothetical protein